SASRMPMRCCTSSILRQRSTGPWALRWIRNPTASPLRATSPSTSSTKGGVSVTDVSTATTRNSRTAASASFRDLAERAGGVDVRPGAGDGAPPPVERVAPTGEADVHTFQKPDPIGKALLRHRDQHGDVGVERLGNELDQSFAFRFRTPEAIDD